MAHSGSRGIALLFLDHGTRRRWGVSVTPQSLFTPRERPGTIVQEAGCAPGPVWTGAENLAPTGIRSPDRPARSLVAIPTELPSPFLNRSCMQMIINFTGYPSSCLPPVSGRRKIKTHKTIILCHVLWVCVKLVHREEQTLRVFVNSVLGKVTNSGEQSFLRKC